jgi:hypothetical protein
MSSSTSDSSKVEEVLFETVGSPNGRGSYSLATLNKPKALNALTLNMINLMTNNIKVHSFTVFQRLTQIESNIPIFCFSF